MNGIHDLGGMDGLGPVRAEANEPAFHQDWEKTVMGLFFTTFAAGCFNVDEFRHAIERMNPLHYLGSSYYEHWLEALYTLLVEKGVVSREEIAAGHAAGALRAGLQQLPAAMVETVCKSGAPCRAAADAAARFEPGARVRARNLNPRGHTRLPRYVRGHVGTVEADHGVFAFPDRNAHGSGPAPQRLYNVRFTARELWGDTAPPRDSLVISMFDAYLEPA